MPRKQAFPATGSAVFSQDRYQNLGAGLKGDAHACSIGLLILYVCSTAD